MEEYVEKEIWCVNGIKRGKQETEGDCGEIKRVLSVYLSLMEVTEKPRMHEITFYNFSKCLLVLFVIFVILGPILSIFQVVCM